MEEDRQSTNEVANDSEYSQQSNDHHGHHEGRHENGHTPHHQPPFTHPEPVITAAAPTPMQNVMPATQEIQSLVAARKPRFWSRAFAYLPEYLVMLVLLSATVSAITSLIGTGIDSLVKSESKMSVSSFSSYGENFSSFALVASLSTLAITLPLFILLFARTKGSELDKPAIKGHRWRKGFLAVFLVVEGLALIWTLIDVAYDLIGRAVGSSSGVFSLISSGSSDPWWQVVLVGLINALLITYVLFVISRDYRQSQEG